MKTVLYARVSCVDQTIAHQRTQAEKAGFQIDEVVADEGISGVHFTLAERAQGKRLFDILRHGDTLVVRWVDRLGRNYADVTEVIRQFMRKGVVVRTVIASMSFDGSTKDPIQQAVRDALIGFLAATAEAQAEATKASQRAGIDHARSLSDGRYLGRKPSYTRDQLRAVGDMLASGKGISAIAHETGLTRQTVYRLKGDPAGAEAALNVWSR